MATEVSYKNYTIRIEPYDKHCSRYCFVVIDPEGREVKHVQAGGDTEAMAQENAEKMIDFEYAYSEER